MNSATGSNLNQATRTNMSPPNPSYRMDTTPSTAPLEEIDVEDLLQWAYQNQSVESVYKTACREFQGPSPRPGSIGKDLEALQTRVDTQRSMGIAAIRCAPDALIILDAVRTLAGSNPAAAKLITHHARTGGCPYWWPDVDHSIEPDRHRNGRVIVYGQMNDAGKYEDGAFCPLVITPDPQEIGLDRADYVIWHQGMQALTNKLSGTLENFIAQLPSRREQPWEDET